MTFGGAYAVLAYIAQKAVETYGWLSPGEMLDGLALAETTPGPLIMVVQYVAFLAAFRHPGGMSPYAAAVLGSLLTTWVTFAPCFLWIFLGAPYVEALRGNRTIHAALSAITAAVVGVILNLSVWFAVHTIFHTVRTTQFGLIRADIPEWSSIDLPRCCSVQGARGHAALQVGHGVDTVRQRRARRNMGVSLELTRAEDRFRQQELTGPPAKAVSGASETLPAQLFPPHSPA